VDLNGVGGWTEFRTFNLPYPLKACTFSMYGKMSAVLGIVRVKWKLENKNAHKIFVKHNKNEN